MRLPPSRWCSLPLASAKPLTLPALALTHFPKSSLSENCLSVKNISVLQFFFWSMTQIGHLYYQMPADSHLYGLSKCLITLRKDYAKTESATGWLNHFIGLRHLSVWQVFLAKAEKCRGNINAATGCCQHPLTAECHTGTCTTHPQRRH